MTATPTSRNEKTGAPRILALDLATVGAAAWSVSGGVETLHFDLRERATLTKAQQAKEHGRLFRALYGLVLSLIDTARPDVLAIEKDFGRGYSVLVMLGGLRGVAELAAAQRDIRCIIDIDASTARTLVGGGGGSTPKDVASARARLLYRLQGKSDDEVDALILHQAVIARLKAEDLARRAKPSRRAA